MSEIKTLEEYILRELDNKDKSIELLNATIEDLRKTIDSQSKKLKQLNEIRKFISDHVTIITRGNYDGDSTIEKIDMANIPDHIYKFSSDKEVNDFIKIRDMFIELGAKVDKDHTLIEPVKRD